MAFVSSFNAIKFGQLEVMKGARQEKVTLT